MSDYDLIETLDGVLFDPRNPDPAAINIDTIALVLSRIGRFGGHTRFFYSVAQHSMLVASHVSDDCLKLPALLHDAHEAFTGFGDVQRPAKRRCPIIEEIEATVDKAVAKAFGFDAELLTHPEIRHFDHVLLATERRDVKGMTANQWLPLPDPLPTVIKPMLDTVQSFLAIAQRCQQLGGYPILPLREGNKTDDDKASYSNHDRDSAGSHRTAPGQPDDRC